MHTWWVVLAVAIIRSVRIGWDLWGRIWDVLGRWRWRWWGVELWVFLDLRRRFLRRVLAQGCHRRWLMTVRSLVGAISRFRVIV